MDLVIDIPGNRIKIDGKWVSGQRRWEAAAIGSLVASARGKPVSSEMLARAFHHLGQDTMFDRTAWRRLWASLRRLFEDAGKGEEFSRRFTHRPRALTVGPWCWNAVESDNLHVIGAVEEPSEHDTSDLHAVAKDRTLASTLVVARKLAVVHSLWLYGSRLAAIDELLNGTEWALAAPPILTHRALTLADAYSMTEQYGLARKQLRIALNLMDLDPTCRDQGTQAEFIRISIAEAETHGIAPSRDTSNAILKLLSDRTRTKDELDSRTRAWAYMHAAHGLRGIEANRPSGVVQQAQSDQRLIDRLSAAVCLSIVGWHTDVIPISLEAFLRELAPISECGKASRLPQCIDVYLTAQHWRSVLEIPDAFEVGRLWIALLVADRPDVSLIIDEKVASGAWLGQRPDTLEFFQDTLTRITNAGDPKCIARAALACYRFSDRTGSRAARARSEKVFLETCRKYQTVVLFLSQLGMLNSVPELAAKIDVGNVNSRKKIPSER